MMSWRLGFSVSLGLLAAACTITTGPGEERERRPRGSGGSGGQGASDGDDGDDGEGGSGGNAGEGGSGGSGGNPGDGEQCVESPSAGECEACAFTECEALVCDCKADPGCAAALAAVDYFACLDEAGGDPSATATCDTSLLMEANDGSDDSALIANDLGECLHGNLEDEGFVGCPIECGS